MALHGRYASTIVQCLVLAAVLERVCALSSVRTTARDRREYGADESPPAAAPGDLTSLSFLRLSTDAPTPATNTTPAAAARAHATARRDDSRNATVKTSRNSRDRAASAEVSTRSWVKAAENVTVSPAPRPAPRPAAPRPAAPRPAAPPLTTARAPLVYTARPPYVDYDSSGRARLGAHYDKNPDYFSHGSAGSGLNVEDAMREAMMREELALGNRRNQNEVGDARPQSPAKDKKALYAVGAGYKRGRKLGPVSPRSYYKHPDDNSWRNESISSLGIVFKPNNGSKPLTAVLRGKAGDPAPAAADDGPAPDLRERLEKLAEARKSRKKSGRGGADPDARALTPAPPAPPAPRDGKYKKLGLDYYVGPVYADEYSPADPAPPPPPPAPPLDDDDAEFERKMEQYMGRDYAEEPGGGAGGEGGAGGTAPPAASAGIPDEPEHEGRKAGRLGRVRAYLNEVERERDDDGPAPPPPPAGDYPVLYNTSVLHGAGGAGEARSSTYFKQESGRGGARKREHPGGAGGGAGGGAEPAGGAWESELDSSVYSPERDEDDA